MKDRDMELVAENVEDYAANVKGVADRIRQGIGNPQDLAAELDRAHQGLEAEVRVLRGGPRHENGNGDNDEN